MDERLWDLYHFPDNIVPQDVYLLDLSEQCAHMEDRLRKIIDTLPEEDRMLVKGYLEMRDELEFQSVKLALKIGKKNR